MNLKIRGLLQPIIVLTVAFFALAACDPQQTAGPQGLTGVENSSVTENDTLIYELVNLSKVHGFTVAWDINDNGEIAGGNLFLDSNEQLIKMGSIFARAINNRGQVAGSFGDQAAVWSPSEDLITLGAIENGWSTALDLNNNGDVVGEIIYEHLVYEDDEYGDVYDYEFNAFIWNQKEGITKINADGWAEGINDHGLVAGINYSFSNRAFIWDEITGMQDLGSLHGFSSANAHAINANGQVAGSVLVTFEENDNGEQMTSGSHSVTKTESAGKIDKLLRISETKGIYDYGHVKEMILGSTFHEEAFPWKNGSSHSMQSSANTDFNTRLDPELKNNFYNSLQNVTYRSEAFIWSQSDGYTSLGTLGGDWSTAWDINDHGQVVGYSSIGEGKNRAFLWDPVHGMIELPAFGGNSLARSINNNGEIVGYSYDENGKFYPVMWKPVHL